MHSITQFNDPMNRKRLAAKFQKFSAPNREHKDIINICQIYTLQMKLEVGHINKIHIFVWSWNIKPAQL
jgi:hypothetical protein